MGTVGRLLLVFYATLPLAACARNDPPGIPTASPAASHAVRVTPTALEPTAAPAPADGGVPVHLTAAAAAPTPSTSAASSAVARPSVPEQQKNQEARQPALLDATGQPLPQTEARPSANSPSFEWRVQRLCQAIIEGTPATAHDAFFPLVAYSQVKAVADPARDYRLRLLSHFDRDILDYHRRLARRPGPVRCAGLSVPENLARWMKPGSEYNKLGYYRVLRSHLQLVDGAEKTFSLEVTSLISWRGEWYVVHLNGFE